MTVLLVALGAALGALARWALGDELTLLVNVSGCLLVGVVAGVAPPGWRPFLATGVLGGYTTFSTYSVDAVRLMSEGRFALALGYVLATLLGSLAAVWLGGRLALVLRRRA